MESSQYEGVFREPQFKGKLCFVIKLIPAIMSVITVIASEERPCKLTLRTKCTYGSKILLYLMT